MFEIQKMVKFAYHYKTQGSFHGYFCFTIACGWFFR